MSHTLDGFNRGENCVIAYCSCGMSYYAAVGEMPPLPAYLQPGAMILLVGPQPGQREYEADVEAVWAAATEATRAKWDRHQFIARGGVIYPDGRRVIGA